MTRGASGVNPKAWTAYLAEALLFTEEAKAGGSSSLRPGEVSVSSRPPPSGEPPVDALIDSMLGPAMHVALRRCPDQRAASFREPYNSSVARNLLVLDLGAKAVAALTKAEIPFVTLKGIPTIARFCRDDVAIRPLADADILVARHHYDLAVRLLEREVGLVRTKPAHPVSDRWANEIALSTTGPGMKAAVDLHQSFHNWPLLASFSRWVLDSREEVDGWTVPSIPASILVIAAHRFRHSFEGDARELLDMTWLSTAGGEELWRETIDAAEHFDLMPALYVVYRQAVEWFGAGGALASVKRRARTERERYAKRRATEDQTRPGDRRGRNEFERQARKRARIELARLEALRDRIGHLRAGLLDRLIPIGAGATGGAPALLPSGFVGQYTSMAVGTTKLMPAVTAMGLYTVSRLADEVVSGGKSGFPWRRLVRR